MPVGAEIQATSWPTVLMYSLEVAHFTNDLAASAFCEEEGMPSAQAQNQPEPLLVTSTGAGANQVLGFSSQSPDYQAEVVDRLHLPFAMISDEHFALGDALDLPTFAAEGQPRLYARLTLVVRDGAIEHVFYPVFPPDRNAAMVVAWLQAART